jgi:uncharacterized hydrophobic protein (TIGR00341 family)
MSLRLIEVIVPEERRAELLLMLKEQNLPGVWGDRLSNELALVRALASVKSAEAVLDLVTSRFSGSEGFRVILLPVEATIPQPEPAPRAERKEEVTGREEKPSPPVIREELYADLAQGGRLSATYLIMVFLSAIVAAIGLLRGDMAVIIGAMVIAPLIGPNMALTLATTLGDLSLAWRSLRTGGLGLLLALVLSVAFGFFLTVDPEAPHIASRTQLSFGDILLALAAGSAGAVALTSTLTTALVGVMVAVALLPPLVTAGLLAGAGEYRLASAAFLLVVANVICINLSGVITFLARGIQPRTWWEAGKAKRFTRVAVLVWLTLLALLVVVILILPKG